MPTRRVTTSLRTLAYLRSIALNRRLQLVVLALFPLANSLSTWVVCTVLRLTCEALTGSTMLEGYRTTSCLAHRRI